MFFNILHLVLGSLTSYEALIRLKIEKIDHFYFVTLAMVRVRVLVNNALFMILEVDCGLYGCCRGALYAWIFPESLGMVF